MRTIQITHQLFRSRVAHRLFLLFAACALVPVTLLAAVTVLDRARQTRAHDNELLRRSAKDSGMRVIERLEYLESNLRNEGERLSDEAPSLHSTDPRTIKFLREQFAALAVIDDRAGVVEALGRPIAVPALSAGETERLKAGRSLLRTLPGDDRPSRVLLIVPTGLTARRFLAAEIAPGSLWSADDCLSGESILTCVDAAGRTVFESGSTNMPAALQAVTRQGGASGTIRWSDERGRHLAGYWTLFMKYAFDAEWIILSTLEERSFLAAADSFRTTFPLVILLTLLVAVLASARQIQRQLIPVEKLHAATRDIASGNLEHVVEVRTGDEFEELADSFNWMSRRVRHLLEMRKDLIEVGISLVAEQDMEAILETVIRGARRILRCEGVAILTLSNQGRAESCHYSVGARERSLDTAELERLWGDGIPSATIPSIWASHCPGQDPRCRDLVARLDAALGCRTRSFLGAPLLDHEQQLRGFLFCLDTADRDSDRAVEFGTDGLRIAELLTSLAGVAVAKAVYISARHQYEFNLIRAKDAAEEAERMKSEFLANASHELRTPLNGVIGMAELLEETGLSDLQREFAATIVRSAQAQLHVLRDLLTFSSLEAGQAALRTEPFALGEVVNTVVEMLSAEARRKGLTLEWTETPGIPPLLIGDRAHLSQVLGNLVANAVKFTERGGVSVELDAIPAGGARVRCRILVTDSGIGIPTDQRDRIFEGFTQGDGSSRRKHGGLGLGLAISKRIVEMMGGSIGVESRLGKGSTFWLELPLEVADQATDSRAA